LFAAARDVAKLCRESGALPIINDRADMAALLDAGLHVGQDDLSPRDARKVTGGEAVIGLSSHSAAQLAAAAGEPVDYVALGPIFATASKRQTDPAVGLQEIRLCRGLTEKPLVAIGGITLENVAGVWSAGADRLRSSAACCPRRPARGRCANGWSSGLRRRGRWLAITRRAVWQ